MPYSRSARDAQPDDEISGRYPVDPHAETETSLQPVSDPAVVRGLEVAVMVLSAIVVVLLPTIVVVQWFKLH